MMTHGAAWVARDSFVGALVGSHVDDPQIPPLPPPPDVGLDFAGFAEMEDDGE